MVSKISAHTIYPVSSSPIENGVIVMDENGKIIAIDTLENHDKTEIEFFDGVIVPGFINAHCHLELSHLNGVAQTGTGLIDFISQVIKNRNHSPEIIQEAIEREEKNMIDSGIVAVGDISNTTDTFAQKRKENLFYYTFVEYFDLFQESNTDNILQQYNAVFNALTETSKNKKSKVPHAPYSVSRKLFNVIASEAKQSVKSKTISIHNQETPPENELFLNKTGDFISFYERIGFDTKDIPKLEKPSVYYALEYLQKENRNLFVHNTLSTKEDIKSAHQKIGKENVFWATCPNANLYIENSLPNYKNFLETNAQVCIGTDSLTSNWQLSILEEMKTILKYQSYVDFETVLTWATVNGAKALGFADSLGTIEIGKTPGLVLIKNMENGKLTNNSKSKKIV
ncbi:MAG: amidohydrolase family protein [Sphingobacteriales bacterium]|nr:amidohydrolase family protein [Sphingobacteriales bacterium]